MSYEQKLDLAADMRANPSPPEATLWELLRGSKTGYRFQRQIVIAGYIADFVCPTWRTVVEVDGERYHAGREEYDAHRDGVFLDRHYSVLRMSARTVMRHPLIAAAIVGSFLDDVSSANAYVSTALHAQEEGCRIHGRDQNWHYVPLDDPEDPYDLHSFTNCDAECFGRD